MQQNSLRYCNTYTQDFPFRKAGSGPLTPSNGKTADRCDHTYFVVKGHTVADGEIVGPLVTIRPTDIHTVSLGYISAEAILRGEIDIADERVCNFTQLQYTHTRH